MFGTSFLTLRVVLTANPHRIYLTQPIPVILLYVPVPARTRWWWLLSGLEPTLSTLPSSTLFNVGGLFVWFFGFFLWGQTQLFSQHMPRLHCQHWVLLLNMCCHTSAETLGFVFYPIHLKILKLLLCISQMLEQRLKGICVNYV